MINMYLIVKKDGRRYWTTSYEKKNGFLIFSVNTLAGKTLKYEVAESVVAEISQHEFDKDRKPPVNPEPVEKTEQVWYCKYVHIRKA